MWKTREYDASCLPLTSLDKVPREKQEELWDGIFQTPGILKSLNFSNYALRKGLCSWSYRAKVTESQTWALMWLASL